jgi:uncharacterized protein (DUF736 family)
MATIGTFKKTGSNEFTGCPASALMGPNRLN